MTVIWSILNFILNLPYVFDILIVVFLIFSFTRGAIRGFWRSLWRFIFVVILLDLSYLTIITPFANFINYGFWTMTGLTIDVTLGGTLYQLNSFDDFVRQLVNYSSLMGYVPFDSKLLDPVYVAAFGMALSKALGWAVIVVATHVLTWILSSLLYVFPIRFLASPTAREHKYRPLGSLFGGLTGILYILCFSVVLSPFHYGLAAIANSNQYPYIINEYVMKAGAVLNPNSSFLLGWIGFDGQPGGFLPDIFTFEVTDGLGDTTTYYLDQEFVFFIEETTAPAV